MNFYSLSQVRVGNESIVNIAANVQRIPISDIISHPKYKRSVNYNDVAILKLKTKVLLSSAVYPVCLQTQFLNTLSMTPKMSLIVIGWGATDFSSLESNSINLRRTPALRYHKFIILTVTVIFRISIFYRAIKFNVVSKVFRFDVVSFKMTFLHIRILNR